jgi:hypothetical protein
LGQFTKAGPSTKGLKAFLTTLFYAASQKDIVLKKNYAILA